MRRQNATGTQLFSYNTNQANLEWKKWPIVATVIFFRPFMPFFYESFDLFPAMSRMPVIQSIWSSSPSRLWKIWSWEGREKISMWGNRTSFQGLTIVFAVPFWSMFKTYGGEGDAKIWVWCWSQFFSNFWLLFLEYLLKYLLQYLLKYVLNKWIGGRGKDLNVILKSVLFLVGFHGSLHIVVV